jgi:hypothetical protein
MMASGARALDDLAALAPYFTSGARHLVEFVARTPSKSAALAQRCAAVSG